MSPVRRKVLVEPLRVAGPAVRRSIWFKDRARFLEANGELGAPVGDAVRDELLEWWPGVAALGPWWRV